MSRQFDNPPLLYMSKFMKLSLVQSVFLEVAEWVTPISIPHSSLTFPIFQDIKTISKPTFIAYGRVSISFNESARCELSPLSPTALDATAYVALEHRFKLVHLHTAHLRTPLIELCIYSALSLPTKADCEQR